jgi:uncharacterized protein (DUF58 family)
VTSALAALGGLTMRGRCLLAAGVTLVFAAGVLGQRDLLRAGVFLTALPLSAVAVVARTRYRLACTRRMDPPRVESGQTATARLRLDNVSRLPSGVLLMEDALPYTLGGRPRFVLDKVEPHGVRDVTYPVRGDTRGRYTIGPLSVRLTDPFGLCELTRSFAATDDLIVTPTVAPLPSVRLGGDWAGGGDSTLRSAAASGSEDAATREYRHGDDLRKVHWRSTARVGELMVRREEQPFQSRATLLLDGRRTAHRGDGPASSYEYAVSAVASIAVNLIRAGFLLQVIGETGDPVGPPHVALTEALVLDSLALASSSRTPSLAAATGRLRSGTDGVLIAVLGALDAEDVDRLARLRVAAGMRIAVLLDVDKWAPAGTRGRTGAPSSTGPHAAALAGAGWRVLPVEYGTTLASVWPKAGLRHAPDLPTTPLPTTPVPA